MPTVATSRTAGIPTSFPTDILSNVMMMMMVVLRQGGLGRGGLNFDAKPRRGSLDQLDLFHAHIGGMDALARAFLIAHRITEDGKLRDLVDARYASYSSGIGAKIAGCETSFTELERYVSRTG